MKTVTILIAGFTSLLVLPAKAVELGDELEHLAAMRQAVEDNGLDGLLEITRANNWPAPRIPSQWHVEHVSSPEQQPIDMAARALGKAIAVHLVEVARDLQELPQNEELFRITEELCDLADWVWGIEGYGNIYLANRFVDLAAVGTTRLAANLNFPIESCQELVNRLEEPWRNAEVRVRVLNNDAGAKIFLSNEPEKIQRTWGTGKFYRREQSMPDLKEGLNLTDLDLQLLETPAMRDNLEFFDVPKISQLKPYSLVSLWDSKLHASLINDAIGSKNIYPARALVQFRAIVGEFPEQPVEPILSAQQVEQNELKDRRHKERGIRVVPDSRSPQERAFMQAWEALSRTSDTSVEELRERQQAGAGAWNTYQKVLNGEFLDSDTQRERIWEEEQDWLKQRDAAHPNSGTP